VRCGVVVVVELDDDFMYDYRLTRPPRITRHFIETNHKVGTAVYAVDGFSRVDKWRTKYSCRPTNRIAYPEKLWPLLCYLHELNKCYNAYFADVKNVFM